MIKSAIFEMNLLLSYIVLYGGVRKVISPMAKVLPFLTTGEKISFVPREL